MSNLYFGARSAATRLSSDWEWPEVEDIVSAARDALTRPGDSAWWDDELFVTHTMMFSTPDPNLTDDYTIGTSNYRSILRDMAPAYARFPGAISDASFGHWTYSRFVCVKVRVCYSDGQIHPAFVDAFTIATQLECDYPIHDESDHSELEFEINESAMDQFIADVRSECGYEFDAMTEHGKRVRAWRQTEVWESIAREHYWENFGGMHEAGYIDAEEFAVSDSYAIGRMRPIHKLGLPIELAQDNHSDTTLAGA